MSDEAKRKRGPHRAWVTREAKDLAKLLDKETPVNSFEIKGAISVLSARLEKLELFQSEVENTLLDDDEALNAEIDEAKAFRNIADQAIWKAQQLLDEVLSKKDECLSEASGGQPAATSGQPAVASSGHSLGARLPQLRIPIFDGDILNWTSFIDQFNAVVDQSDLPIITKFTYLRSLLAGDALKCVSGFSLTEANYKLVLDLLKERFGKPENIIFLHVQELISLSIPQGVPKAQALRALEDKLLTHIRCLESLGIDGDQYGVILTPLILSRLPNDTRLEWSRGGKGNESNLRFLLQFLHEEIERRERSLLFNDSALPPGGKNNKKGENKSCPPTAAALVNKENFQKSTCRICFKGHKTESCYALLNAPLAVRKEKIKSNKLCFVCLGNHKGRCSKQCKHCKGRHHHLLCDKSGESGSEKDEQEKPRSEVVTTAARTERGGRTVLQTTTIHVEGKKGQLISANILFDTGSNISYISSDLAKRTNSKMIGSRMLSYAAFGATKSSDEQVRNVYNVKTKDSQGVQKNLELTEVPCICAPISQPEIPPQIIAELRQHGVKGDFQRTTGKIDILIGLDLYNSLMKNRRLVLAGGDMVTEETCYGWVLFGKLPSPHQTSVNVASLLSLRDIPEDALRSFWDLESIGIKDCPDIEHDAVMMEFESNIHHSKGRYQVSLPWKPGFKEKLANNEAQARARLMSLSRRLNKDPELKESYDSVFQDMLSEGMIEEVKPEEVHDARPKFYLPHHPVVKESSVSTKVRPVFDASAAGPNGLSLNDCLFTGPCMIPNLPAILIRFRRWRVAVTADITKAFLQVGVNREDQDVHRFLWDDQDQVRVMRFTRVPFGNKASPFLLNATLHHHLKVTPKSRVTQEMKENIYVDDFLSGNDDDEQACADLQEAQRILKPTGMKLDKIGSNSNIISDLAIHEFESKHSGEHSVKVLGLRWLAAEDCFSFDTIDVSSDLVITKRLVLSTIARLFDPLGFLTPVVMYAKCIFQTLWKIGVDWDTAIPGELQEKFSAWLKDLQRVREFKISRNMTGHAWRDVGEITLHGFGDAAVKGYGACVYIVSRFGNGECTSALVCSRARVAPIKGVTLPRLELLGALLCARLVNFVKESLKLPSNVTYHCWTDSTIALGWIKSGEKVWKPFVQNRVQEIQDLTNPGQWCHCPGDLNPADLVTRGLLMSDLTKSTLWVSGPGFITNSEDVASLLASDRDFVPPEECLVELKAAPQHGLATIEDKGRIQVSRWGSFQKAIRVLAWCNRFIRNAKGKVDKIYASDLTFAELDHGKLTLLRIDQKQSFPDEYKALSQGKCVSKESPLSKLCPFIDDRGLLRVGGRLQRSCLTHDEKHPLILAADSHVALLLVRFQHTLMKHAGVQTVLVALRNQYWIIRARQLAKRVKRQCIHCQKQDAAALDRPFAPLPEDRIVRSAPFSVVGIDHTGVLFCSDAPQKKFYILIITCAVIRAVHLELVDSLKTEDVILGLRRCFARRGLSSIIYSDNAKAFKSSPKKLSALFGHLSPQWKFIVPRAPWWGGWWERLNHPIKACLKKSLGTKVCKRSELETSLHEVEACINSRPLTFVSDEIDTSNALTPNHFLLGRSSLVTQPPYSDLQGMSDKTVSPSELTQRHSNQTEMLEDFWRTWRNEYIRNLPPDSRSKRKGKLSVGSVVLIQEEDSPRLQWPMGVVTRLNSGKDGIARAIEVRTAKGIVLRPIQKVHNLEVSEETPPGRD